MWPCRTRFTAATLLLCATASGAQEAEPYLDDLPGTHPSIAYLAGEYDDPVARLAAAVASGETVLEHGDRFGYLPSLLDHLEVPTDSQALVFSKTSLQAHLIGPRTPRAIYFNDRVAVAFVPGSELVELAAFDPRRGGVFYTLDTSRTDRPRFDRPDVCLQCHQAAATLGVPGPYVGSVSTSATGRPDFRLGTVVTDHRTPFEERWGGWYVTGTHGAQRHRGNALARDPTTPAGLVDPANQNLRNLTRFIDPDDYLRPTSDLVALMTLEHQTHLVNLYTRAGWEARIAEADGALDETEAAARATIVEQITRYMLFADEAPLSAPIRGVSSFTATFPTRGPRDAAGRSLRDFDLDTRLFRHRLSFLFYSDLFDGLPDTVRMAIYDRLLEVLTGTAIDGYEHLSAGERRMILEIVRDTKPGLPDGWR